MRDSSITEKPWENFFLEAVFLFRETHAKDQPCRFPKFIQDAPLEEAGLRGFGRRGLLIELPLHVRSNID